MGPVADTNPETSERVLTVLSYWGVRPRHLADAERRRLMIGRTGRVLAVGVLLLGGACAPAGKMTHDMNTMIQQASTKADHEALAAHYEEEARALRAKATEHEMRAQAYAKGGGYVKGKTNLIQHCNVLAAKYREVATEYLDLAKEHRELAAAAPQ
jgi:hypothetical protein